MYRKERWVRQTSRMVIVYSPYLVVSVQGKIFIILKHAILPVPGVVNAMALGSVNVIRQDIIAAQ